MPNRHQRRAQAATGAIDPHPFFQEAGVALPPDTKVTLHPVPNFFAASLQIGQAINDFSLQYSRLAMGTADIGGTITPVAQVQPVAEIVVSAQTMKDFAISMMDAVEKYEAQFGVIETAFTRQKAAEATS